MLLRADLIFSYWIFAWYLLYILKIIKYNPKGLLLFGIFENLVLLCILVINRKSIRTITIFILGLLILKIIPYFTVVNTHFKMSDFYASIMLFILYFVWLTFNNTTVVEYQKKVINSVINDKNETPFMYLVDKLSL